MRMDQSRPPRRRPRWWLHLAVVVGVLAALGAGVSPAPLADAGAGWSPFASFFSTSFSAAEQTGLFMALAVSLCALAYAWVLGKKVSAADRGTQGMQAIAQAVRDGSDAYLRRQFTTVSVLLVFLTVVVILTKWPWDLTGSTGGDLRVVAVSRGLAFLLGAVFSATVGFFGMRLATTGNLRVAAAARRGFAPAMRLAYQTGTVTGMLTTGLGLLGGCLIVLAMGEKAYETLLGFAFGGSLLALFMRVGGGIYTKAADVGADLVGKVEQNIPEDDPRNAATIADNVGDNVGDCAGMAADVFESYTVTMVAAMILGFAAFGTKAMLLPLFIMAIGIVSSMISTSLVGRRDGYGGSSGAMRAINNSFRVGAGLCAVGVLVLGGIYLRFDRPYIVTQAVERGLYRLPDFRSAVGLPPLPANEAAVSDEVDVARRAEAKRAWKELPADRRAAVADLPIAASIDPNVPSDKQPRTIFEEADRIVPVREGVDLRPAFACLVGIVLTLALMFCTEYWTSTEYHPVRSITKNSRTGDATNIIQGIAVGYESTVWAVILIAAAVFAGVFIYQETNSPLFIAFGVSLAGIGMLALTGDTLSMDVFGPVSDNANGIGEMGYNREFAHHLPLSPGDPDYIPEDEVRAARQILTDLDATGNTTKAITKGIAIGSAVIAAVSLFASFIAVLVKGSEERINELTTADFQTKAGELSVARPEVFIGMLIGGAIPFLFSSMTIRAVGRAAYLIVNECRRQFRDQAIWEGTKRPDYGRVVDICTGTAQRELVGPGLLAIFTPILVGFLLGPFALGGFLAGMIVVGQLLAVFMATAGGAWDNAKKMIEDQEKTDISGKGSPQHKASVTGDTVGDPLKDTAGPAINPLIKVMNMVSLLVLPLVMAYNIKSGPYAGSWVGYMVIVVGLVAVSWAWWQSKRDTIEMHELDEQYERDLE
ncbi:MAG TPA: sodium/proton-translocating pyrophosphatase, partial [Gemmataceae bacterium]|nr:sodium/proton-translocating pyrophosphatase [Gemmataceae bacterium]